MQQPTYRRPNPYESRESSRGPTLADLRVELAEVRVRLDESVSTQRRQGQAIADISTEVRDLRRLGTDAIQGVPGYVSSRLEPFDKRLKALETHWWEPMRPHLWKVYGAAIALAFAFGWKRVTGEPLPLVPIVLELLKH